MPNIDSSEYIRKLKLTAIYNANKAANQRKFRELTRFDSYDPSAIRASGAVCNDVCVTTRKDHNIFAAQAYSASRVPHFRRPGGVIVIDFMNKSTAVSYSIPTPTNTITFQIINNPDTLDYIAIFGNSPPNDYSTSILTVDSIIINDVNETNESSVFAFSTLPSSYLLTITSETPLSGTITVENCD